MRRVLGLVVLLLATPRGGLLGQTLDSAPARNTMPHLPDRPPPDVAPRWRGHAVAFGANAAIGAVTAGLVRAVRGEPVRGGIVQGAAGGGVAYAGKYLGTQDFPLAALVGRQTTALGASLTRNAGAGEAAFGSLTFPLGPVRFHRNAGGAHLSLDLPTVAGTVYALTRPGARLDVRRTLSTGALVFAVDKIQQEGNRVAVGRTVGGTILYRNNEFADNLSQVIAHEVVHVLQHDFAMTAWGDPFESWLARRAPSRLAVPLRTLDFGSYASLKLLVRAVGITGRDTPWEREAYFMAQDQVRGSGFLVRGFPD